MTMKHTEPTNDSAEIQIHPHELGDWKKLTSAQKSELNELAIASAKVGPLTLAAAGFGQKEEAVLMTAQKLLARFAATHATEREAWTEEGNNQVVETLIAILTRLKKKAATA